MICFNMIDKRTWIWGWNKNKLILHLKIKCTFKFVVRATERLLRYFHLSANEEIERILPRQRAVVYPVILRFYAARHVEYFRSMFKGIFRLYVVCMLGTKLEYYFNNNKYGACLFYIFWPNPSLIYLYHYSGNLK